MKTTVGKVAIEDDKVLVQLADGTKIPVNTTSMGNKNYDIGEEVKGVILNDKFNICREYIHGILIFGFVSHDNLDNDKIGITEVKVLKDDTYKIGKEHSLKRNAVTNY